MLFEDIFLWETKDICFLRLWSAIIPRIRMNSEKKTVRIIYQIRAREREKMKKLRWKKLLKNNLRNSTSTSNSFPKKYTSLPSLFMDGPKHMYSNFIVQYNALFCIKNRGTRRRRRKGQEDAFSGLPNMDFYNRIWLIGLWQRFVGLECIIHTLPSWIK